MRLEVLKILIVDDNHHMRVLLSEVLRAVGLQNIYEAGDGAEALSYCTGMMPDVVLLDWNMPVMDGLTFLRRLRGQPGGDGPKVLFCTIETAPDRIAEALAAGADEYVMKPFDSEIIHSKLAEVGAV